MDADATRAVGKAALVVGVLGVVFGDIGTSPIYTIQTAFDPGDPHPIQASLQSVYGVLSLIFWSVVLIVAVKYVGLVMTADNEGEGGIMALISQIRKIGKEDLIAPRGPQGAVAHLCIRLPLSQRIDRLLLARLRGPRDHRGRGSLCRHGSLRASRHHARLAAAGLPGLHPQLPRSGSTDP